MEEGSLGSMIIRAFFGAYKDCTRYRGLECLVRTTMFAGCISGSVQQS